MQVKPDGQYKLILVNQDHLIKYSDHFYRKVLKKWPVHALLDIFTTFCAPSILPSNNGREFSYKVVTEHRIIIVHGKS